MAVAEPRQPDGPRVYALLPRESDVLSCALRIGISEVDHNSALVMTVGALLFGAVVGFITYRTLIRTTDKASISDLGAVVGVIGGGAGNGLVGPPTPGPFGWDPIRL